MGNGIEHGERLWYKDAVIYELHVRAFYDGNGDGIGDFEGLIQKLDYLGELGVTAVWLLPFYPSPLKDDGYDISDYLDVHQDYGTLAEFRRFLREAHRRGIRVITELVINHTSDQHQWFQRARKAEPGSMWRDYYVWSETPEKYKDARIIFKDFERSNWAWDEVAKAYYWHRFYSHQPDLNFESPHVRKEIFRVVDFWLGMGVDGMRLDAIPYLFQRDGTNCEDLPETHAFIKELRAHIDGRFADRMLLAEANQWPEDAAKYFGKGDECHMVFNFPAMPRLFMALQMEDRFPIMDIIEQSRDIPEDCQWALFLRNHDELTLETVTDEERDYMYRTFARDPRSRVNMGIRRRLAPLLENNRRKIELLDFLLCSLPGTPVIYYGDEIGMGDNCYLGDRNGVRTPMQWTPDRNAGFSDANPQSLYLPVVTDSQYNYEAVNVENQAASQSSLLWFVRRLVAIRKRFAAFGRGTMEFVPSNNPRVLTFIRQYGEEAILVVVNLSRFCQVTRLELSKYADCVPDELFGGNEFPPVTQNAYVLTLGPYNAFWFRLKKAKGLPPGGIRGLAIDAVWEDITDREFTAALAYVMADYIKSCRWFEGANRQIQRIVVEESISFGRKESLNYLLLIRAAFTTSSDEIYMVPVSFASSEQSRQQVLAEFPHCVIAELQLQDRKGLLYEGSHNQQLQDELLDMVVQRRSVKKGHVELAGDHGSSLRTLLKSGALPGKVRVVKGEHANTSIVYGNSLFLKLYNKPGHGPNPEIEISRYLTEESGFDGCPRYAGSLELRAGEAEPMAIGILLEYVQHESDAWNYSLDSFEQYAARAASQKKTMNDLCGALNAAGGQGSAVPTEAVRELIGAFYLDMVALLGNRTAQMHRAMASFTEQYDGGGEPLSMYYQKSLYQSMRSLAQRVLGEVERRLSGLDQAAAAAAGDIVARKQEILARFANITKKKITGMKIRIHGDYHLAQVLYTGKDFVITDFEGEAALPLSERHLKRSPLRDVAGMMRSFHYAAHAATLLRPVGPYGDAHELTDWADLWHHYVSRTFLSAYLEVVRADDFVPREDGDIQTLLEAFLLQRALFELGDDLRDRPEWLGVSAHGIRQLLGKQGV
jgi:maltose alpha-D-glucosyltransferase / alpha-amylase